MAENLRVELGDRSYEIQFRSDLAGTLESLARGLTGEGRKIASITDKNVSKRQPDALRELAGGAVYVAAPGERSKSVGELGKILEFLAAEKLDRSSVLFAIGGGVIGDLGGFAAASYLRGIDYWQVPTTLLAMVDSSVGGKTGVNLNAGKNLAGAFHQPRGVLVSTSFLDTLPRREFAAGCAEIIKYGLLGDAELFARLERKRLMASSTDLADVIRRCCAIKAGIVAADERETAADGGRALLNLGHTFGHAIEQTTGYRGYLHGEAVAIGIAAAARLSQKLGYLQAEEVGRIERTIEAHRLPIRLQAPLKLAELQSAAARDKKVRSGVARFVVLRSIGKAAVEQVPADLVADSFKDIGAV